MKYYCMIRSVDSTRYVNCRQKTNKFNKQTTRTTTIKCARFIKREIKTIFKFK